MSQSNALSQYSSSFTHTGSSHHHLKQLLRMSFNTESVYNNAMSQYRQLLEQKGQERSQDINIYKEQV